MTGFIMKIIAMGLMLIDHIGVCTNCLPLRIIGRPAFPVFAFMLAIGAMMSRNKWRYLLRIGICAILSEVPYDLLIRHTVWDMRSQNVCFTLIFGILLIFALQRIFREREAKKKLLFGLILAAGLGLVTLLEMTVFYTDYGLSGVLMILFMGLAVELERNRALLMKLPNPAAIRTFAAAVGIMVLCFFHQGYEWFALFALIPIFFFNRKRGYKSQAFQLGSYFFYPLHMLILDLIFVIPYF